jgi:hypothetical protein
MTHLTDQRLAWIFGSSRSGSTWLLRMLADTGDVVPIDDPHLGHHLGTWRPISLGFAVGDECPELTTLAEVKSDKPSYFLSDRYAETWRPALRELIAARFGAQAQEAASHGVSQTATIVVKEPASQAAELLLSLFEGSKLIFLLRDGRDVVDSWLDAYSRGSWALEEGAFAAAPSKRLPLVRWLASVWLYRTEAVQRAYARHDPARRLLVRYEHLLSSPREHLSRIAELLQLDVSRADLDRIAETRDFDATDPAQRGNGKPLRLARPGGWRENLRPREREVLSELLGSKLEELGYSPRAADRAPRFRVRRAA